EILINPQRQILFVAAPGYIEQRVALVNPSPKEVFYFEIEERSGQDEISVFFNIKPEDAQLFVDNVPTEINKTVSVPLGMINIRLEREGYRPIAKTLITSTEKVNFEFSMQTVEPEIVHIIANEPGARVNFDGMEKGVTDQSNRLSLFFYPGEYTVEVQKSGFLTNPQTIVIEEGKNNTFRFQLEKHTGLLILNISPENAEVYINKSFVGADREIERPPGRYRVDIELQDHEPYSETFDLERGERKIIRTKLEPHLGSLQFSVKPSNAQVVLKDDHGKEVKKWEGLQLIRDLPAGEYEIDISLKGHITQRWKLRVNKNERETLEVTLNKGEDKAVQTYTNAPSLPSAIHKLDRSMVFVEGGTFTMGCTREQNDDCSDDEKPAHKVSLDDFFIGKYEVTVAQFAAFIEATGYITDADKDGGSWVWTGTKVEIQKGVNWRCDVNGKKRPQTEFDHPVIHVSWNDAMAFCEWMSEITDKKYRLPTEAEWEYAARGGNRSRGFKYSGSNNMDDVAWYRDNSNTKTHTVGQKQPNELGLYDMSGNVWEWCSDWYSGSFYASSPISNPAGPPLGSRRVLRGGSWNGIATYCRVTIRISYIPYTRYDYNGFRVALTK
ncbi:MAG: SUMF1/EgtB/PvdO family nonheme iron enzyme, partial [Cryomorphaceae bacterium]|nr:SUMF1/EgtB/PvdO family nonheme iron enzyme [Cryomorphaceae bacterium]